MSGGKAFEISQQEVLLAYKQVKANKGAGGVDGVSFEIYENKNNLYKLWNRMSSGSYFPKSVRGVEIPKKNGKKRLLGIPTVEDRVAQMVVRNRFEKNVEPIFLDDSYGYRPGKSALDAIKVTRERCWRYEYVLELDIVGLFDNIDHELLMKAVKAHSKDKWVNLYIERMLKADIVMPDGVCKKRIAGTPQGGVISPVLANLFLHYAFDVWMEIVSFPGLDRSVTIEGLKNYRVSNRRYRNRRIGDFLKELHLTEGRNTGFKKIIDALEANGSPKPEFETDEDRSYFITRLFVHEGFLMNQNDDSK